MLLLIYRERNSLRRSLTLFRRFAVCLRRLVALAWLSLVLALPVVVVSVLLLL